MRLYDQNYTQSQDAFFKQMPKEWQPSAPSLDDIVSTQESFETYQEYPLTANHFEKSLPSSITVILPHISFLGRMAKKAGYRLKKIYGTSKICASRPDGGHFFYEKNTLSCSLHNERDKEALKHFIQYILAEKPFIKFNICASNPRVQEAYFQLLIDAGVSLTAIIRAPRSAAQQNQRRNLLFPRPAARAMRCDKKTPAARAVCG